MPTARAHLANDLVRPSIPAEWGPNWGVVRLRPCGPDAVKMRSLVRTSIEEAFMFSAAYLQPPANPLQCVNLPLWRDVQREDGIVLVPTQDACRGRRISRLGCPLQEGLLQPLSR